MTEDEIRALVVALEHQSTPLSRMTLRLLTDLARHPHRTKWVGEAFEDLHHIRNDTEVLRSQMRKRLGENDEV